MRLQPAALGERQDLPSVETAGCRKINVFDAGV
jgi:hypothetical protein